MEENSFKPIEEPQKQNKQQINLPNLKKNNQSNEEIISELPNWNIEPPVEINRGQNEVR